MIHRWHYKVENKEIFEGAYSTPKMKEIRTRVHPNDLDCVLIASEVVMSGVEYQTFGQLHAPVLDIDFEAKLLPSSTPGHYHLYLEKKMTWRNYKKLLKVMAKVGILEEGYVRASVRKKASFLRPWWVTKAAAPLQPPNGTTMSYAETKAQELKDSCMNAVRSLRKTLRVASTDDP